MSSPLSTEESTKRNARAVNQRHMKPKKCSLGKTQRRRLWVNLRKYCDDLFAMGLPPMKSFQPPQHAVAMFSELGLRHPNNLRALCKFYDSFIPRCGHLVENGTSGQKRKGRPTPGCSGRNGSPPPAKRTRYMSSQGRRSSPPARMPTQQQIQAMQAHKAQAQQQMQATQAQMAQQQMAMPMPMPSVPTTPTHTQQIDQISRWLASNTFEVPTPSSLHGVPINRSQMRNGGLNILSTGYSTKHPDPAQALQRNEPMIVFGSQRDAQKFGAPQNQGQGQQQMRAPVPPPQRADPAFCREMVNKRMLFVPVPPCLVGSTLAETPQLSQAGINALSVNMRVQQPSVMAQRRFVVGDTLICLFDDSFVDKHEKLTAVFEEIQHVKQQLNLRD